MLAYRFAVFFSILVPMSAMANATVASANVSINNPDESGYADFSALQTDDFQFLTSAQCRDGNSLSDLSNLGTAKRFAGSESFQPDMAGPDLFSWTPTGFTGNLPMTGCEPEILEKSLLANGSTVQAQAAHMHDYFARCDASLRQNVPTGIVALLKNEITRYDLCDHPNMRKVVMRLANGDLVRGFLALKPGTDKRPLIIAKCGVFCNAGQSAERFLMMHLFDESPFNVLAISNVTGSNFVRDNGFIAIGGFYEGQQIILIAKMVREGNLGKLVSSVHFVGESLGSQAGLYASYLSPFNTAPGEQAVLASSLAACPVVDLQEAMRSLFSDSVKGWVARSAFNEASDEVIEDRPQLYYLFPPKTLPVDQLTDALANVALDHMSHLKKGWALPPFENLSIKSLDQFWAANKFLNLAKTPLVIPTLAFAGDDDEVVPAIGNAKELQRILEHQRRIGASGSETDLAALTLPSGNHCAFDEIYGWRTMSTVFRSFVLSHSPEMAGRAQTRTIGIPSSFFDSQARTLYQGEKHVTQEFQFAKGSPDLKIAFKIFAPWLPACATENPKSATGECYRMVNMAISFTEIKAESTHLPHRALWARPPLTSSEAESLTRWANVHLTVVDSDGQPIALTSRIPAGLKWNAYEIN